MHTPPRRVLAWSDPGADRDGNEFLTHHVAWGDDEGEPLDAQTWKCSDYENARTWGGELAYFYELEFVADGLIDE